MNKDRVVWLSIIILIICYTLIGNTQNRQYRGYGASPFKDIHELTEYARKYEKGLYWEEDDWQVYFYIIREDTTVRTEEGTAKIVLLKPVHY